MPDYAASLVVQDSHNKLHPFSRDKLFLSLFHALEYREDSLPAATELTKTVIGKLLIRKNAADGLLSRKMIAKISLDVLKRFDAPSSHTYKAFHLDLLG